jgi:hypothetical protein
MIIILVLNLVEAIIYSLCMSVSGKWYWYLTKSHMLAHSGTSLSHMYSTQTIGTRVTFLMQRKCTCTG